MISDPANRPWQRDPLLHARPWRAPDQVGQLVGRADGWSRRAAPQPYRRLSSPSPPPSVPTRYRRTPPRARSTRPTWQRRPGVKPPTTRFPLRVRVSPSVLVFLGRPARAGGYL